MFLYNLFVREQSTTKVLNHRKTRFDKTTKKTNCLESLQYIHTLFFKRIGRAQNVEHFNKYK
mgnify:CR=1 FL=1